MARVDTWKGAGAVKAWQPRELRGFVGADTSPLYIADGVRNPRRGVLAIWYGMV